MTMKCEMHLAEIFFLCTRKASSCSGGDWLRGRTRHFVDQLPFSEPINVALLKNAFCPRAHMRAPLWTRTRCRKENFSTNLGFYFKVFSFQLLQVNFVDLMSLVAMKLWENWIEWRFIWGVGVCKLVEGSNQTASVFFCLCVCVRVFVWVSVCVFVPCWVRGVKVCAVQEQSVRGGTWLADGKEEVQGGKRWAGAGVTGT